MAGRQVKVAIIGDAKQFNKVLNETSSKLGKFGSEVTAIGQKAIKGFAVAGAAVGAFAAKSIGELATFEAGMNEVFTLLPGISEKAMGDMTQQVKDFSKEFGVLNEDLIPSLYNSLSAGVPPGNVFDFLETANKLAKGGATDLATAVDGLTSVVNAFGSDVISVGKASDLIFTAVKGGKTTVQELSESLFQVAPIAASLGVEFGDVTAALATLTAAGTPTAVAATQLRAVFSALAKPSTEVSKIFKEITGKDFAQFVAAGGDVQGALEILKKSADENGVSLNAYFGRVEAANAAQVLTGKGAAKFASELDAVRDAAGATDEAFNKMEQGLQPVINRIKAASQVLILDLAERIVPMVEPALIKVKEAFDVILPAIDRVVKKVQEFTNSEAFIKYVDIAKQKLNEFQAAVKPIIDRIREFFDENPRSKFAAIAATIATLLIPIIFALISALSILFSPIVLITAAIAALAAGFTYAYDNFEGFRNFVDKAVDFIKEKFQAFINFFKGEGFQQGLANSIAFVRDLFTRFMEFIRGEGFQNAMTKAFKFVVDQFNNLKEIFKGIVGFISNLFKGDVSAAVISLQHIFKNLLDFFRNNFDLMGTLKEVFMNALDKTMDFIIPRLKEFGKMFIETISTVMKTSAGVLLEGVRFVMNRVIDKINGFINDLNAGLSFSFFGIDIDPPDIPNIPRLAKGGIVNQPTIAMVGESGPEAVIPLNNGMPMGNTINITVNAGMGADGADIGSKIVDELKKFQRSNGSVPITVKNSLSIA